MTEYALRPGLVDTHRCALGIRTQNKDEDPRPPIVSDATYVRSAVDRIGTIRRRDETPKSSPWQFPASAMEKSETSNPILSQHV